MISRVVIYARVSTQRQTEGASLEEQVRRLEELAARKGWAVVARYIDAGASGRSIAGRAQFQAMLAAAERHEFDAVLVTAMDRFARNMLDSRLTRERLQRLGIAVLDESHPEPPARYDVGRWASDTVFEFGAEFYSQVQSGKVHDGIAGKARRGLHVGDVPFGYRRPDPRGSLVPDPAEASAVAELYERYATRRYSLADLARWLTTSGHQPHSKRGRTFFTKSGVKEILHNPVYVGDLVSSGEVLPGLHAPIVGRDLFARVQAVRHQVYRSRASGAVYLLSGIGRHAECGAPLWANGAHRQRPSWLPRYRCGAQQLGLDAHCQRVTAERDAVDAEVSVLFEHLELPPDWREEIAAASLAIPPAPSDADRRRLEDRLSTVRRALLDGLVPYAAGAAEIRALERERAALAPLPSSSAVLDAGDDLLNMRELWPHMTADERREAVRLVLSMVAVDLRGPAITGLQPREGFAPLFAAMASAGGPLRVEADGLGVVRPGGFGRTSSTRLYVPAWRAA